MQVAFTKPCLVKGIVKKASMEVCPWIASSLKFLHHGSTASPSGKCLQRVCFNPLGCKYGRVQTLSFIF